MKNFKKVDSLCFTAPFKIDGENIIDLSHCLKEDEIQLIFNNSDYNYKQFAPPYTGYSNDKEEDVVIIPIKKSLDEKVFVEYIEQKSKNEGNTFKINIKISDCPSLPKSANWVYLRFRIKSIDSDNLIKTLKLKSNYLESAFTERQIIDFKLNNVRNMDKFLVNELKGEGFQFTKFKSIHLFIMVPTDYEMAMWGNFADCRQLEKDEWNRYLSRNMTKRCKENDISAYHWKQKSKDNELVEEFAQLIKMEHKTTNVYLILIYCAIVIVLGALGSALCGWILLILKLIVCLVKVIF